MRMRNGSGVTVFSAISGLVASVAGCSFGSQSLDAKWSGATEPVCGPSMVWTDRIIGGALAVSAGVALMSSDSDRRRAGMPLVAGAALYEFAAVVGGRRQAECRLARKQWAYGPAISLAEATPVAAAATPPVARSWAAGVSDAEQAQALALYGEGNEAYAQRRYAEAVARYRQAVVHWDHPAIRFNMVVCLMELAKPIEARYSIDVALAYGAEPLGAEAYARALAYRDKLDRILVRLTLDCPEPDEDVELDRQPLFKGPGTVTSYLLPGLHQIVANKPGFLPASLPVVLAVGQPRTYHIRPHVDPRTLPR